MLPFVGFPRDVYAPPSLNFKRTTQPQEGPVRALLRDVFIPTRRPLQAQYDVEVLNGRQLNTEELDDIVDLICRVLGEETGGKDRFVQWKLEKWEKHPGEKAKDTRFINSHPATAPKAAALPKKDTQRAELLYELNQRDQIRCAVQLSGGALTVAKDPETGKPVATVLINPLFKDPDKPSKRACYLMSFAVDEQYRGKGLGKLVNNVMEKAASQLGYQYVVRRNTRGTDVYEDSIKAGYQEVSNNPNTPKVILEDCPKASYPTSVFVWRELPPYAYNPLASDDIVTPTLWAWMKEWVARRQDDLDLKRLLPAGNEPHTAS